MTWVRIDDAAPQHPKVVRAGPAAAWLWVCGMAFCNRFHTDGAIPRDMLGTLHAHAEWSPAFVRRLADRLVKCGLWHEAGDGYRVHDYADYQEEATRSAVEARREASRDRKRRQRDREKTAASATRHAVTGRDRHADSHVVGHAESRGGSRVTDDVTSRATDPVTGGETPPIVSQPPGPARPGPARPDHEYAWGDLPSRLSPGSTEAPWSYVEAAYRTVFQRETGKTPGRSIRWRADFETLAQTLMDHCRQSGEEEHVVIERVFVALFETADDFTKKRGYPPSVAGEKFGMLEAYGAPETAPGAMAGWIREAEETRRAVEHLQ